MDLDVKELRRKLDISQEKLSEMTGIPKGRINNWEQGRGKPKGEDSRILEKIYDSEVLRSKKDEDEKKETGLEEISLLIKNLDRMGSTNEYLLKRVMVLEKQLDQCLNK